MGPGQAGQARPGHVLESALETIGISSTFGIIMINSALDFQKRCAPCTL